MNPPRRAYTDTDTLYVITEAVRFLADLRQIDAHPQTGALSPIDSLHLLASLTLQAQTWTLLAIDDALDTGHSPEQIAAINPALLDWLDPP